MIAYAIVFLIITVLCAMFAFLGLGAAMFASIAKVLFFVFLMAFVVSAVMTVTRRA